MPPKRKANTPANDQRAAKRSGAATPQSIGSSDEFGEEEASETEAEDIQTAVDDFSIQKSSSKRAKSSDSFGGIRDYCYLQLKPDHLNRPITINPTDGSIIVETWSPVFLQAQDFLTTIAEPQSRPRLVHEYVLTAHSLYAAVSVGLDPDHIIEVLDRFCKTAVPEDIKRFIKSLTNHYGKVKLVLKHNKYFLESSDLRTLQILLEDGTIASARIAGSDAFTKENAPTLGGLVIPGTKNAAGVSQNPNQQGPNQNNGVNQNPAETDTITLREDDDDEEDIDQVHSFEIAEANVEIVQKRCLELKYPLLQEYDFRNDQVNANLEIDLRPSTRVRDYQEKCLSKMFGNGRSKSGIIVLPCGAGKTLVGICAAVTVKKGVVILCTSSMSVVQWRNEFLKWSNINPNDIAIFTADHKEKFPGHTGIIISTYSMITQTRSRSHDTQKMMDWIQGREWGLMILDEVHVVPASIFRKVTHSIATHSKLGLTATLLREDDKIRDLNFLIGPKLYEANWMELAEQGHIARVQCAEVWCPMTTEFMQEYLSESSRKQSLLYTMNPRKFQACQFLIDFHEKRGDKIIVFSDNVYALKQYALKLGKAYIYGGTGQSERMQILENFQHNPTINTIFLSKIGDTSLDLPEATCLIQISSHYGSRRQEAQRLGRILRAKRRNDEGFNAFFYSLVSKDTTEMLYAHKRQKFLTDQGYAYKVITHLKGLESYPGLAYASPSERRELLQEVMLQNETSADVEHIAGDLFGEPQLHRKKKPTARRTANTLAELSGGQDMAYVEYNKSKNKELKGKSSAGSSFFKKMHREQLRRKQANAG